MRCNVILNRSIKAGDTVWEEVRHINLENDLSKDFFEKCEIDQEDVVEYNSLLERSYIFA